MNATNTNKDLNVEPTTLNRCAQSYKKLLAGIEQAKDRIANEFQETLELHGQLFQLAMKEAEALARRTEYPHLFFPSLAMEKVQAIAGWSARQEIIKQKHSAYPMSI